MKNGIYGVLDKYRLEISLSFDRWLIGFGWIFSCNSKIRIIHINIGPLALIYTWRRK